MIDQQTRVSTIVKDELAKAAAKLGVDKTQVGFYVGPTFAPVAGPDGQTGLFYSWVVTVTLRLPLLGYPAILVPVIVTAPLGTMPQDDAIRGAVTMGLENASKTYQEVMADAKAAVKLEAASR